MLIEDCAHAHASEWRGQRVGTFGVGGTFSFQSSKLMTAGEGGMIISNDDGFERQARSVHDCGRLPGEWFYSHFSYGSNYRLSEWQGVVLMAQLGRLDRANSAASQERALAGPRTQSDTRHHSAKARRTLHPQWSICIHLSRRQQTVCRHLDGELYRCNECRRHSEPGQLSSTARAGHVPQRGIPQAVERNAGHRRACFLKAIVSAHPSRRLGNGLDSAACAAGR